MGWDEDYTRQVERFLSCTPLPEPFCLIVSLVNPHDVLGYPHSYAGGGYRREQFPHLRVPLPPTIDERLVDKPIVQSLMQLGQTSYVGPLRSRPSSRTTSTSTPTSTASSTRRWAACSPPWVTPRSGLAAFAHRRHRISDHGEMGLSHGGLRQKMFNAYEETIRVPLVFSNPWLFEAGR